MGVGVIVAAVVFALVAPFYNNRIEADLERRVPTELAAAGFVGLSASFSGQDGRLTCLEPLGDPDAAEAAAHDVWGVQSIALDRSCRVHTAPVVGSTTTVAPAPPPTTPVAPAATDLAATVTATSAPTSGLGGVADLLRADPRFSLLSVLVAEAGLDGGLFAATGPPITLFAPTDAAFDLLAADQIASLRADSELLERVLRRHIAEGRLMAGDLVAGPLDVLAGPPVEIARSGDTITIEGAVVVDADALAGGGVVHAIDDVLLPHEVLVPPRAAMGEVSVSLAGRVLTLEGAVATDAERALLTDAAAATGAEVEDLLELDLAGVDDETAGGLARLVALMPTRLLEGEAGFDGEELRISGVVLSPDGAAEIEAVAGELDAVAELVPRPVATGAAADLLEQQVNALVAESPIRFEPGGVELSPEASPIIDAAADLLLGFDGLAIVVEGHTDGDGSPARNAELSQGRAEAVLAALVERGVHDSALTPEGLGSQRRIFVDGSEDKEASRRVEFRVTVAEAVDEQ